MIYFKEYQSANNAPHNQRIKTPKILSSNNPLNNSGKKGYSFNKNKGTMHLNNQYIKRPSTAPQKDKNNKKINKCYRNIKFIVNVDIIVFNKKEEIIIHIDSIRDKL